MDSVKSNVNFSKCAVILLDVAGTTTSIPFVQDTLFKFVSEQAPSYLKEHWAKEEVSSAIKLLKDGKEELELEAATELVEKLTKEKSTNAGLKALQGLIYSKGYSDGTLKAHVFPDVKAALENWSKDHKVAIYSTGSVESQKLLFKNTIDGDLTPFISYYFDQSIGLKTEASSYTKIASEELSVKPEEVLFISDNTDELKASSQAGYLKTLVIREGNAEVAEDVAKEYNAIKSFADVTLETSNKRKNEEPTDSEAPPTKVPKTEEETSEEPMDTSVATTEETTPVVAQGDVDMETDCGKTTATTTSDEIKTDESILEETANKVVESTDLQNKKSTEETKTVELSKAEVNATEVSENENTAPVGKDKAEPTIKESNEPVVEKIKVTEKEDLIENNITKPVEKPDLPNEPVIEAVVETKTEKPVEKNAEVVETNAETVVETKAEIVETKTEIVETKTETVVETKAETAVETKAETVVETKSETVVETKTETVVETTAKPIVETQNGEPALEMDTESVVETKVESVAETKVESVVETKAESVVETKPESVVETKAEPVVEANGEKVPETTAETVVVETKNVKSVTVEKTEPTTKEPIEEVAVENGSINSLENNKTENKDKPETENCKDISANVELATEAKEINTEVAEEATETPKETKVSEKTEAAENGKDKENGCDNKIEITADNETNDIIVSDVKNGEIKNGDCEIDGVKNGEDEKKSVDDNAGNEIKVKSLEPSVGSPAVSIEV